MIHKTIKHIHRFRLLFLLFISVAFLAMLGLNPIDLSKYYGASFGKAVGMTVGIPENPISKLALELRQKEDRLEQREKGLELLEIELNKKKQSNEEGPLWFIGGGIVVLFLLIIINFVMDYHRRRRGE